MENEIKHKIIIQGEGETLTFTGIIISMNDGYFTFKDKFNKTLTYNKDRIIYFERIN